MLRGTGEECPLGASVRRLGGDDLEGVQEVGVGTEVGGVVNDASVGVATKARPIAGALQLQDGNKAQHKTGARAKSGRRQGC